MNLSGVSNTILNTGTIAGDSGVAMFLVGSDTAIENRGTISGVIEATTPPSLGSGPVKSLAEAAIG